VEALAISFHDGWRNNRNNNALENSTRVIITGYTKVCSSRELSRSNEQTAVVLAGSCCSLASVAKCAGHVEGRHLAKCQVQQPPEHQWH
jgi:hypothetical protein